MPSAERAVWAAGLGRDTARRKRWAPREDDTLRELVGACGLLEIAQKLGRSYLGVSNRLRRLGYSVKSDVQDVIGLPLSEVAGRVGVPHHQIYRDARAGVIPHLVRVDRKMLVVKWEGIEAYRHVIERRLRKRERVLSRIKEETLSKAQFQELLGVRESQATRYLMGKIVKAWKIPVRHTDASEKRWEWRVSKRDAERVAEKRSAGKLRLRKRSYRQIVERDIAYVRRLRAERRTGQRTVVARRHAVLPGHMTVSQIAQEVGLSDAQVYQHIELGRLKAVRVPVGGKSFVCVPPEAVEAYRVWCARPVQATGPIADHKRARAAVAAKGLLTIAEAVRQYGVKSGTLRMACRTRRLAYRLVGGLIAIEPREVAAYAERVRPRRSKHETH